MPTYNVRSGGDSAALTGTYATLALAIAASTAGAGNSFVIASDHVETAGAATTYGFKGTLAVPDIVSVVDPTTGASATGAQLKTNASAAHITFTGAFSMDGVNVTVSDTVTSGVTNILFTANGFLQKISRSTLVTPAVNGSRVNINGVPGRVIFDNVQIAPATGYANGYITIANDFEWRNSQCYSATMNHITTSASSGASVLFYGCDLSNQSSKDIRFGSSSSIGQRMALHNCKLATGWTPGTLLNPLDRIEIVNCSTSGGKIENQIINYWGTASLDNTVYRSTGAHDETNGYSVKMVSSASALPASPLESQMFSFWVPASAVGVAKTATLYLQADAGATLSSTEFSASLHYLADSTSLLTTKAAGTVASDTSTWTGGTTPTKYKVAIAFTPQKAGMHTLRALLSKPSVTVYLDETVVLS